MIWWRVALFLGAVYVAIRLCIPALVALQVPFEVRALVLSLLPLLGWKVAPWLVRPPREGA